MSSGTTFAAIWGVIGLITKFLDAIDVLQIGFLSIKTTQCGGDVSCFTVGLENLFRFAIEVMIGPLLLAANLMTNPTLGIIVVLLGIGVIYIFYPHKQ